MKNILALLFAVLLFAAPALSNTVTESGDFVQVQTFTADFTYTGISTMYGATGEGVRYDWIMMVPGLNGCYVTIKDGSDSGPVIFYSYSSSAEGPSAEPPTPSPVYYNGSRLRPVIDYSDSCTAGGTKIIFKLWKK